MQSARKNKLFEVLLYCITVVQGLHHPFKISIIPHFFVDGEKRVDHVDDVQETANSLGFRSSPAALWSSLPSSSSLHGAP